MRYYAKKLLLTHDGTVKMVVQHADIDFEIDPLKFIESMTKYGDYREVGLPVPEKLHDTWYEDAPTVKIDEMVDSYFQKCEGFEHTDYDTIESEEVSGYKFVVTDRKTGVKSKWVNVENGSVINATAPKVAD